MVRCHKHLTMFSSLIYRQIADNVESAHKIRLLASRYMIPIHINECSIVVITQ